MIFAGPARQRKRLPLKAVRLFWALMVVAATAAALADVLETADGRTLDPVAVERFETHDAGSHFFVFPVTEGQLGGVSHPLPAEEVATVKFQPWDAPSSGTATRPASLVLDSAKEYQSVLVESYEATEGTPHFLVRDPGLGDDTHPVEAAKVTRLLFLDLHVFDTPTTPARTPVVPITPVPDEDLPVFNPFIPNPALLDPSGGARNANNVDVAGMLGIEPPRSLDKPDSPLPPALSHRWPIPLTGLGISLTGFLAYLIVGALVGAWMLLGIARKEQIEYTPKKAFLVALLIAIVYPLIVFYATRWIIGIGFVVGLILAFFAVRILFMAALGVLEDKATSLMMTYWAVQIAVLFVVASFVNLFV